MPAASTDLPLRHPYLEHVAPGIDRQDQRAAYFEQIGEWPHALSAYLAMQRADGTRSEKRARRIERLRERWREADGDTEAVGELRDHDFKRLLQTAREAARAGEPDLLRDAVVLREAHRRNPDDRRVQHMLSINYLGWLAQSGSGPEIAVGDYVAIDDAEELAARVDRLVEPRRRVPHWLVVCPSGSGTWQLRDYLQHLGEAGRARFLVDAHQLQKQRLRPVEQAVLNQGWLAFAHLSRFTDMRFVVAGNLHDPVQALVYSTVRKEWRRYFRRLGEEVYPPPALITAQAIETIREMAQAAVDRAPVNDLEAYFEANYERPFGFPLDAFQIQHRRRGYFVGFHRNLTFVLTRLADLETVFAPMLDRVLGIETADRRPVADFRVTSPPAVSRHLRDIAGRIAVPRGLVERSLNTGFMERYFLRDQLDAMRRRWGLTA